MLLSLGDHMYLTTMRLHVEALGERVQMLLIRRLRVQQK